MAITLDFYPSARERGERSERALKLAIAEMYVQGVSPRQRPPFTGGRCPQMRNFTDGSSNTILVVKAGPHKAVPWTQPVDLPLDPANPISALGQSADGSFLCAIADGSVRTISAGIPPQTLKNAIQPDDGNPASFF